MVLYLVECEVGRGEAAAGGAGGGITVHGQVQGDVSGCLVCDLV